MVDNWAVTRGCSAIPEDILNLAANAQATLGDKLAALRSLSEPFPNTVGPAAGDRWISEAGPPKARTASGTVEEPRPSPESEPAKVGGDLTDLSAAALLDGYQTGAFNPVEMVDACLTRINDTDIGAAVTRDDDAAREQAARSAQRWRRGDAGPLEGVPVGVKDIIDTAGLATTAGSNLYAGRVPPADAAVVARLRDAGAVILAKTTTPEFAFGDETGDGVTNPAAPGRWAGGSSSGSAAGLAAGIFPVALGSDTGGSIRVPSSYCGVSGLKPTFGRVPRDGVFGVSWTLDHVGPMARTVEDLELVLSVIAGRSQADPYSSTSTVGDYRAIGASVQGLRVGVPDGWLPEGSSPGVAQALSAALALLEQSGCTVETVPFPHAELAGIIAWVITVVEFAAHHAGNLHRIGEFTPSAACRLAAGARTSAADYLRALRARELVQRDLDAAFERVDVLVTAATPTSAPNPATFFDDGDRLWLDKVARNFLPFNVTGNPALVVPVGSDEGRPAAVQIVAPHHNDALCLHLGRALQSDGVPASPDVKPLDPAN
ncbi:MAG: amidase [Acidimicrobiaceae bacterium]|nr:amidase [Acidimicrobiaceae bacterium]MYH76823.1 amidase [Acidimicrobiaceae bacterium]MYK76246.1 amidase [Acidimicrobiaceae bacterium]